MAAQNRYAIIISSSVMKSSVKRHYWKRIIFAEIKKWRNIGYDILVIARPPLTKEGKRAAIATLEHIRESLLYTISKT